jgi:hypothetical protein
LHDHLIGPDTQPPHLVIDLGGLVVLGALEFTNLGRSTESAWTARFTRNGRGECPS